MLMFVRFESIWDVSLSRRSGLEDRSEYGAAGHRVQDALPVLAAHRGTVAVELPLDDAKFQLAQPESTPHVPGL